MSLTELLPAVRQLPALDKLRLIRILAEELDSIEIPPGIGNVILEREVSGGTWLGRDGEFQLFSLSE